MDDVTEPAHRPSRAFCEMCYYDKEFPSDPRADHEFQLIDWP